MIVRLSFALILILNCSFLSKADTEEDLRLELIQVIFRHGDRVPDKGERYDTDPNPPSFYESLGYGKLTSQGRLTEYKLGQMLRQRYNHFLGDYRRGEVYAFSSSLGRTQESLEYVLTGLYTPARPIPTVQNIDHVEKSNIPYAFKDSKRNFLRVLKFACPKMKKQYKQASESPEIMAEFKKYRKFVKYVEEKTHFKISKPREANKLYRNLRSSLSMNLPLPEWCPAQCYKTLQDLASLYYSIYSMDKDLSRYIIGPTMEVFLRNILNEESSKKIYLYSAHDINIATITRGLHVANIPEIPDFGSSIIVEKWRHAKNNRVYVRMLYWTGVTEKLMPIRIEGCDVLCPLKQYESIMQTYLPSKSDKQCLKLENEY